MPMDVKPTTTREFMLGEGAGTGGGSQNMHVGVGPAHPAMHGIIRIVTELDGEVLVKTDVEIGYLHRAFEKECEQGAWNNAIPYTDRLNYVSAMLNGVGYVRTAEKMLGIEIPERGQLVRTIRTGPANKWTKTRTTAIPDELLLDDAPNYVAFTASGDFPAWSIWGVREVSLTAPCASITDRSSSAATPRRRTFSPRSPRYRPANRSASGARWRDRR